MDSTQQSDTNQTQITSTLIPQAPPLRRIKKVIQGDLATLTDEVKQISLNELKENSSDVSSDDDYIHITTSSDKMKGLTIDAAHEEKENIQYKIVETNIQYNQSSSFQNKPSFSNSISTESNDSRLISTESEGSELVSYSGSEVASFSPTEEVTEEMVKHEVLKHAFGAAGKANVFGDVIVRESDNVHVGNVTYITGPVHIKQTVQNVVQQNIMQNLFVNANLVKANKLNIIDRRSWLAQPPLNPQEFLSEPAKYVIISHTATESATTQADNVFLVRTTQTFHIESRRWNDIAYNFLIGCDGNVYEGRGWNAIGAHTYGYNDKGLGISFVGCFIKDLPPQRALNACKQLIERGVELGAVDKDYILLGHCQCSPFESPGKRLFEEIKTWDHWQELEKEEE